MLNKCVYNSLSFRITHVKRRSCAKSRAIGLERRKVLLNIRDFKLMPILGFQHASLYTLATGYVLSMAAKKLGSFDLAIFGNKASDAETAQTGPVTAGFLGLPLVTSVDDIDLDGSAIVCRRSFTNGIETSKTELPAVITVTPAINTPRFMTPANVIEGLKKGITVWNCTDLGCDEARCGVKGSPSRTKRVTAPQTKQVDATVISGSSEEIAGVLTGLLADMHII